MKKSFLTMMVLTIAMSLFAGSLFAENVTIIGLGGNVRDTYYLSRSKVVTTVKAGEVYPVVDKVGWVAITLTNGKSGWIHSKSIDMTNATITKTDAVYAQAGVGKTITSVKSGVTVKTVGDFSVEWYKIEKGWVYKEVVKVSE